MEAIYAFARTADDIADEGDITPAQRLADLAAYRDDLAAAAAGGRWSARWPQVFAPLAAVLRTQRLPLDQLSALLDAFTQDVTVCRYADRSTLLDYCSRSANPVGRLLLHLYGIDDAAALARSDAICTALQLANFWQDLGIDTRRGRLYVPASDCRRHGVDPDALLAGIDGPPVHALVRDMVAWARQLMNDGAPLVRQIPGRAGWELRLVVQGGLRILERIDRLDGTTLVARPALGAADAPAIVWRSLRMSRLPMSADSARRAA